MRETNRAGQQQVEGAFEHACAHTSLMLQLLSNGSLLDIDPERCWVYHLYRRFTKDLRDKVKAEVADLLMRF